MRVDRLPHMMEVESRLNLRRLSAGACGPFPGPGQPRLNLSALRASPSRRAQTVAATSLSDIVLISGCIAFTKTTTSDPPESQARAEGNTLNERNQARRPLSAGRHGRFASGGRPSLSPNAKRTNRWRTCSLCQHHDEAAGVLRFVKIKPVAGQSPLSKTLPNAERVIQVLRRNSAVSLAKRDLSAMVPSRDRPSNCRNKCHFGSLGENVNCFKSLIRFIGPKGHRKRNCLQPLAAFF